MGLDFEMAIHQHYFEVLDVVEDLFETIFLGLEKEYGGCFSLTTAFPDPIL
jgi:aspartyl-tRNA synthetase